VHRQCLVQESGHTVVMGAVTADTDTARLTSNADDADCGERASAATGVVNGPQTDSSAADVGPTSTKTHRRRFATIAASAALFFLLLMFSGGFCVWTVMRLSRIEARLERLERIGRLVVDDMVEAPHSGDPFTRPLPVCTVVIFIRVSCDPDLNLPLF